jgi:nicotinate-nucleotide pyrophosphorylase (carboxylating)
MGVHVTHDTTGQTISDILDRALAEDLTARNVDITSQAIFSPDDRAKAVIKSKATGVLSGVFLLAPLFAKIEPRLAIDTGGAVDGGRLLPGTEICRLEGPVLGILAGERTALNLLQRLSGIATLTAAYAGAIAHTRARLLDTRKTTPGLRLLEKMAVRHGGGTNHRFGLFDMILIKDTHVKRAGGVAAALRKAMSGRGDKKEPKIEIEVQTVDECVEALALGPDRIMLDNMNTGDMRRCVSMVRLSGAKVELEASGGITLETIASVAETGVDFISCGALTHSAPALDIHLVIV